MTVSLLSKAANSIAPVCEVSVPRDERSKLLDLFKRISLASVGGSMTAPIENYLEQLSDLDPDGSKLLKIRGDALCFNQGIGYPEIDPNFLCWKTELTGKQEVSVPENCMVPAFCPFSIGNRVTSIKWGYRDDTEVARLLYQLSQAISWHRNSRHGLSSGPIVIEKMLAVTAEKIKHYNSYDGVKLNVEIEKSNIQCAFNLAEFLSAVFKKEFLSVLPSTDTWGTNYCLSGAFSDDVPIDVLEKISIADRSGAFDCILLFAEVPWVLTFEKPKPAPTPVDPIAVGFVFGKKLDDKKKPRIDIFSRRAYLISMFDATNREEEAALSTK